MRYVAVVLAAVIVMGWTACCAETFVVSEPRDVEDTALLDREFGGWNFGAGIMLEAGFMPGLYELHHGASLIRFNLTGLNCGKVESAKLRLYKPNCTIQKTPVAVELYEVAAANGDWGEGSTECWTEKGAATWRKLRDGQPWAGAVGCSEAGTDYLAQALDVETAPLNRGAWVEFDVSVSVVQKWIDDPTANAGLYIRAKNHGETLGDHVYFYSSEHYSGKGPQLIIESSKSDVSSVRIDRPFNKRYEFPKRDAQFENWLDNAGSRYVRWIEACNMNEEQALLPYYWDIIIRGEFLLPRCRLLLSKGLDTLDECIEKSDEKCVREELKRTRQYLLVWEYIREVRWYDSGPLAEELSPLQLAQLWNQISVFQNEPWKPLTDEQLDEKVRNTVEKTRRRLELTPEAAAQVDPVVKKHERLENFYLETFKQVRDEIEGRRERGEDDVDMLDCVRRLHDNHELFLYHQSTFNTPRWTKFMEHAKAIPLAKEYLRVRRDEYNAGRIGRNQARADKYGRINKHKH